jgi:hypothetical protein
MLTDFYKEILKWVDTGKSEYPFLEKTGLCSNLIIFADKNNTTGYNYRESLYDQFHEAGLSEVYPFNEDRIEYVIECHKGAAYMNASRINWIKKHATSM